MSLESWKEWVIGRRQEYSQRLKSAQRTNASECSSWPTVKARDWKDTLGCKLDAVNPDGTHRNRRDRLVGAIAAELFGPPDQENPNTNGKSQESWATPQAQNFTTRGNERKGELGLLGQVKEQWPTPIQTDCKNVPYQMSKGRKITRLMGKANGKLNPNWVEQLMGLPVGWTQLPTAWIG
tara:strand:- start:914 stop:1453 length:540 start_codon:yes stop_codon:yes gene_type:complete